MIAITLGQLDKLVRGAYEEGLKEGTKNEGAPMGQYTDPKPFKETEASREVNRLYNRL